MPGAGVLAAGALSVLVCWAVVDPRHTSGDFGIAVLILLSSCIGFCVWMCGPRNCATFVRVAASGTRPHELLENAAEQGDAAMAEEEDEHATLREHAVGAGAEGQRQAGAAGSAKDIMDDDAAGLDLDDFGSEPGWLMQASGAIRGALVGATRVLTRPAQMKVLVWLAKRKWRERTAGGAAGKAPASLRVHAIPAILSECVIGTVLYDAYARAYGEIGRRDLPWLQNAGNGYLHVYAAGAAAGATTALLSTPHNNVIQKHADTVKGFKRALSHGDLKVFGPNGIYRGLRFAMVRDAITTATMFTCVTFVKRQLPAPKQDSLGHGVAHAFIAGGLGGMAGTAVALPFTRAHAWSTQYAGSHFFGLARKMAIREGGQAVRYMLAGIPPLAFAAFLPNAIGMATLHLASEANKTLEAEDDASAKGA